MKTTSCDNCGSNLNKNKSKKCSHVFCNMKCRDEFRSKKIPTFQCDYCDEKIKKQKTGKHIFCNTDCKVKFNLSKYNKLTASFNEHWNEAAYLFGLIMGDGHFKKSGEGTTRISIAFNVHDTLGFDIADEILQILNINYFTENKTPNNCKTIGFILPNNLLSNYRLLFHGNKYKNQPKCPAEIYQNINFAIGLLNSDGCLYQRKNKATISFTNTVTSIVDDFEKCLLFNEVNYKKYIHTYAETSWKKRFTIAIMQKTSREKIINCNYSKWNHCKLSGNCSGASSMSP